MTERMLCATMLAERVSGSALRVSVTMNSLEVLTAWRMAPWESVATSVSASPLLLRPKGQIHLAGFVAQKDVAALDLGELERRVEQGGQDLVDGVGGIQLARRLEKPAQLVERIAGGADLRDLLDDVADGGGVAGWIRTASTAETQAGTVECAEMNDVPRRRWPGGQAWAGRSRRCRGGWPGRRYNSRDPPG